MTKAERILAAIKEQKLYAELFKSPPFNLIGQRVDNPKHFEPRPTYKQEQLFNTNKGER